MKKTPAFQKRSNEKPGDIETLELADVIDSAEIQSLMDDFYRLTNIGVGIIDLNGNVLVTTGWQEICTKFHRVNPQTCKHCIESDTELSKGVASGTFKYYHCKNNMWDIATPIIIEGVHLGNLFLGQFFFDDEEIPYDTFRLQAQKYGFNEEEYIVALEKVPRWNKETVNTVMSFYSKLTHLISIVSYSNIELARTLDEREITIQLLNLFSTHNDLSELIHSVTELLNKWSGCEAVGIRIREGEDYPYYQTMGFSESFVNSENSLCTKDINGQIIRDELGNPVLECMCGNIINGRFNPMMPFFTDKGSFWTNSTTELLKSTNESDRMIRTRNRCNGEGYESVALIPLRTHGQNLGLIQLNDSRKGLFTAEKIAFFERLADNIALALSQLQTNRKLQESENRIKSIFKAAPIGIGVVTDRIITDVNTLVCKMSGYSAKELIGTSSRIFYPTQEEYEYVGKVKYRFISENGTGTVETKWKRKDGSIIDILLSSTPIDTSDLSKSVTFTALDITERKKAEEALLYSKVVSDDTNRIKSEFMKNVSHELRTPLTSVIGFSDILLEQDSEGLSDAQKNYVGYIHNSGQNLLGLINKILDFSKYEIEDMDAIDLKKISLNILINEIMMLLYQKSSKKNINIYLKQEGAFETLYADEDKLTQIIHNLLDNAVKFTNEGGSITIETRKHDQMLQISVTDTGIGIEKDNIENIFKPFVQIDGSIARKYDGTGIGLALTEKLVKLHSGSIWVDSEPGKGSNFTFEIPINPKEN
ncbi:PocR ligand-binding domain-containing protein [Methanolobus sp. ZRKC5]|uniref:PocR ligand-binding domain-containing protein n=1 Tax=unclassified Methanolobus TaxID=2629569 RepID=UPI00313B9FB4